MKSAASAAAGIIMKEVVIIQRIVCEYRKAFFRALQKEAETAGINLRLIVGSPRRGEEGADVLDQLSFGERKSTTYFYKKVCWIHGLYSAVKKADMVIFVQENAALYIYPLLFMRLLGRKSPALCFWGHGANMGRTKSRILPDMWRRFWLRRVDWWFAYTTKTKGILTAAGFPSDKITVVNNSTDTVALRTAVNNKIMHADLLFSEIFGRPRNGKSRVGIFCGRLIESKMISFLLDSIRLIHEQLPDFFMIIIGDGPLREDVGQFCAENSWCKWVGAKWSTERADYLAVANIWLNPGAVGLAVTDAFAVGLPLATTDNRTHGPEIAYLEHTKTGLITETDVDNYASEVLRVLTEDKLLPSAKSAAADAGRKYSVESMAARFADGIESCLTADKAAIGFRCRKETMP